MNTEYDCNLVLQIWRHMFYRTYKTIRSYAFKSSLKIQGGWLLKTYLKRFLSPFITIKLVNKYQIRTRDNYHRCDAPATINLLASKGWHNLPTLSIFSKATLSLIPGPPRTYWSILFCWMWVRPLNQTLYSIGQQKVTITEFCNILPFSSN